MHKTKYLPLFILGIKPNICFISFIIVSRVRYYYNGSIKTNFTEIFEPLEEGGEQVERWNAVLIHSTTEN